CLGAATLAHDFAMAHLVATCLARPAAIAADLARDLERIRSVTLDEEADPLFTCPAFRMQAGIDNQAARQERQRLKIAEPPYLEIIIKPQLVGELLGVERPALGIGIEGEYRADQGHLVRIFTLPHMPWNRFMHCEVRQRIFAVQVGRTQVDPELARNAALDRPRAAI